MEEETTVCTNCQRPIASSNYVMHSLHCHRNLEKCPCCGEAVPRTEMGVHLEQHADISCSDCGEKVAADCLEVHKANKCKARTMSCAYCTLEMPGNALQEHEDYCGSRTERCDDCGRFVMLKYQQMHLDSNHTFMKLDEEPSPSPPPKLGDFLVKKSHRQSQSHSGLPPNETGTEASLDRFFALRLADQDEMAAGRNPASAASSSRNSDINTNDTIPCEFCSSRVPFFRLLEHQTACRPDVTSFANGLGRVNSRGGKPKTKLSLLEAAEDGWNIPRPVYTLDDSDDDNLRIIDEDDDLKIIDDDIDVELPCEFCQETYPGSVLERHQAICESRISGSGHHWSLPTPGARRITPPQTRKRLSAAPKVKSEKSSDDDVTRSSACRNLVPPVLPEVASLSDGVGSSQIRDTTITPVEAVPKQKKSRKKYRAPAPPTHL